MRLDTGQHLRLEQRMKLSPRMIQAMEILQLPLMALEERIEQEVQANPVLEVRQPADQPAEPADTTAEEGDRGERDLVIDGSGSEDFERLAQFEREYGPDFVPESSPPATDADGRDRKMDAMANTPAHETTLVEYLQQQWLFVEAEPELRDAGTVLIDYIDADGYIRTPLEEIAAAADPGPTTGQLREALKLVQTLDPLGVGARDLKECLLIQLRARQAEGHDVTLEIELVSRFLRDIEANRLPQIARRLGRSIDDIKAGLASLSKLNPRPGSTIGHPAAPAVNPDVIIEIDEDGQIIARTPDGRGPRLHISREYRRMVREKSIDTSARKFLQTNIRSAQWLMTAVEQRRETIRRVAEEVFTFQRGFLDDGPEALKPLPMSDVAEKVGVHVATVSRAVAGKYAQTPRGIFPLRMFFSGGTRTAQGQDVSWDAVKVKLQEIVDSEDKNHPLSDDDLAAAMKTQGIDIARRTVAKYRGLLNIPPARQRRQY
jgi:RNA polymerase sigma-54 factor